MFKKGDRVRHLVVGIEGSVSSISYNANNHPVVVAWDGGRGHTCFDEQGRYDNKGPFIVKIEKCDEAEPEIGLDEFKKEFASLKNDYNTMKETKDKIIADLNKDALTLEENNRAINLENKQLRLKVSYLSEKLDTKDEKMLTLNKDNAKMEEEIRFLRAVIVKLVKE